MNKQITLPAFNDELAQVRTKKKEFLAQMDRIIPWGEWKALIQPYYYKGERGNKPYELELIRYEINRRPSQIRKLSKSDQRKAKKREHAKSFVRAKVEHVFGVVKGLLKFKKTRYRGLRKQET